MSELLWLEVLNRAIIDAQLEPRAGAVAPRGAVDARDARTYLTTPSKDLATVCSMAGVEMVALIERMKLRIAGAGPLRIGGGKPTPYVNQSADPDQPQKRRPPKLYEFRGAQLTVRQLSELSGVSRYRIYDRLQKGWPIEAVLDPAKTQGQQSVR